METPKIFADFHNADFQGRVRLITHGTINDIEKLNIKLIQGLELILDDYEEFTIKGVVEFSTEENIWVCKVDWNEIQKR